MGACKHITADGRTLDLQTSYKEGGTRRRPWSPLHNPVLTRKGGVSGEHTLHPLMNRRLGELLNPLLVDLCGLCFLLWPATIGQLEAGCLPVPPAVHTQLDLGRQGVMVQLPAACKLIGPARGKSLACLQVTAFWSLLG